MSSHGCKVTFRAVGWRVRQRDYEYRRVNYPFGKVVSIHFLRVASVRVEEQPRKRPTGYVCKNVLAAGRVLRQARSLTIMPIDRDYPPDCTHLSKWRPATGQVGQPLLPPCRASCSISPWRLSSASGRRGSGEVSSRTAVVGSGFRVQRPRDGTSGGHCHRNPVPIVR